MKELDTILEECLDELTNGASTLDECLVRYPEHAAELYPLLLAALRVQRGRGIAPSPAFKARTRAQLMEHTRTHPRSKESRVLIQAALSVAFILMLFLVTGTVFAQSALPGDMLYHWKLASENTWRSVSPDPLGTDLGLANRRVDEIVAVAGDEVRVLQALEGYRSLLQRFQADQDSSHQTRIASALSYHRDRLAQAGLLIPELDNYYILIDNQVDENNPPLLDNTVTPDPASH
jgi:hypothetical protein